MFGSRQTVRQRPRPKSLQIYISWYINDYGRPWTSSDPNPKMRHVPGQIAGSGGVLPVTTEQKASSPSPVQSEHHVREPRWDRSLVSSVYVRLRSLVFGLMRRCRSRTLTVSNELSSLVLKIGRSSVHQRPHFPP
jgi:hypothetical protein